MNKKKKTLLALPIVAIILFFGYSTAMGIPLNLQTPELEFPIEEVENIERLAAYHTPDWGEEGVYHNGIDLIIGSDVTIIAPSSGTITEYSEHVNPYAGNVLFSISITINLAWQVKLVLEPGFQSQSNNSLQTENIDVDIGERVKAGDMLATLLHSDNYPHLHYMLLYQGADVCAYNYSSALAKAEFETIASESNSTIFYPHESPTKSISPAILIPIGLVVVYVVALVIVFRKE